MLRKTLITLMAIAALGLGSTAAMAKHGGKHRSSAYGGGSYSGSVYSGGGYSGGGYIGGGPDGM